MTSLKSQSPQTGQFNSYIEILFYHFGSDTLESQSPQTGQFNSYKMLALMTKRQKKVSIPSNGSIQFLQQ